MLWALPAVKWDNSTSEARTPQSNQNPCKVIKNFRQPEFVGLNTGNIDRHSSKFFKRPSLSQPPCATVTSPSLSSAVQTSSPTIRSYIDRNALLRRSSFGMGKTTTAHPEALRAFSSTSLQCCSRHTPDRAPIRQCPHRHHRQRKALRSERKAAQLKALPYLPPRYFSHPLFSFNVYSTVCWIAVLDFWIVGNIRESPRNTAPIIHRNQSYILETISVRG